MESYLKELQGKFEKKPLQVISGLLVAIFLAWFFFSILLPIIIISATALLCCIVVIVLMSYGAYQLFSRLMSK